MVSIGVWIIKGRVGIYERCKRALVEKFTQSAHFLDWRLFDRNAEVEHRSPISTLTIFSLSILPKSQILFCGIVQDHGNVIFRLLRVRLAS